MTDFTLDTSGAVYVLVPGCVTERPRVWSDLSPFAQGYVEALFASFERWPSTTFGDAKYPALPNANGKGVTIGLGFSSLAPETLAAILKDCEAFATTPGTLTWATTDEAQRSVGRSFWLSRNSTSHPLDPAQHGTFTTQILMSVAQRFGALTPYLDDTGKVRLREAG